MRAHAEKRRSRGSGIVFGLVLMAVGLFLTLQSLDLIDGGPIQRYWPLVVVAVGAGKLVETWGTTESGSGLTLVLSGFWMLAVTLELWGLTWQNSWFLILVIAGLGMVLRSVLVRGPVHHEGEEAGHGR